MLSYASLTDLANGSVASGSNTAISLSGGYTVSGFTWDGSAYRVLTADPDAPAGQQIGLLSYATFDDLLNGNVSAATNTSISLSGGYQAAGLTWDGTGYQLFTQSSTAPLGQYVGVLTFDTLSDLVAGTADTGTFTQFSPEGVYRVIGSATITDTGAGGVPEPGVWALMLLGFGGVGLSIRRQRQGTYNITCA